MTLTPGSRLGVFELAELLGRGGMGEVYRATDTKLKRQVAIKVLPPSMVADRDRLARFQREAEVLASLNHPNIAQIYGVEESEGVTALVMELVEGDDLSQRIARGAIPLDEALPIAKQIAEALEAAHEQGIIHRDLKPANIKVRPDGTVKVLDFGLAKAMESPVGVSPSMTQSPTLTTPAMTQAGMILGTAAYMAPEQAKGRPTDKRSDAWAFGCVLFEMLTARRAFDAEDVSETLAAVLRAEPDWTALPPETPASIVALLRRCLTKDRKRRIADMSTAIFVIDEPAAASPALSSAPRVDRPPLWRRALPVAATAFLVAAIAGGGAWYTRPSSPPAGLARFPVLVPDGQTLTDRGGHTITLSPDGTNLVYAANQQLYIRNVAEWEARLIPGTAQAAEEPFFSPDGQWVGFYAASERKLKKIPITGGASVTICDADPLYGASWAANDRILFGQVSKGILQVSANGGKPDTLFTPQSGEIAHGPQLLPGGDEVLFTLSRGRSYAAWDGAQVATRSLTTGAQRVLIEGGSDARYLTTGHLVYTVGSTVFAIPFDAATRQVTGGAVPVVEGVTRAPTGTTAAAQFSASETGAMAYVAGVSTNLQERTLALVDRAGVRTPLNLPPGAYEHPRVSPTGKQLALNMRAGGDEAIWIYDLTGLASLRRLTFGDESSRAVWTPDGQRLAFASSRQSERSLLWQRADGSGAAERLAVAEPGTNLQPESWTPDGKTLVLSVSAGDPRRLARLDVGPDSKPSPLVEVWASNASLSPNGRWLAYHGRSQGRVEVYVQPFPPTGSKYQISTEGGRDPVWSPDGKELFYLQSGRTGMQVVTVGVQTQATFAALKTTPLPIEGIISVGARAYDVTPDGKQFVAMFPKSRADASEPQRAQINVTINWFAELKRRVPTK